MTEPLDDKKLADWKAALAESGIKYETDEQYQEAMDNLVGFFDVLIRMDQEQKAAKEQ